MDFKGGFMRAIPWAFGGVVVGLVLVGLGIRGNPKEPSQRRTPRLATPRLSETPATDERETVEEEVDSPQQTPLTQDELHRMAEALRTGEMDSVEWVRPLTEQELISLVEMSFPEVGNE